jgi:YfiH family protein
MSPPAAISSILPVAHGFFGRRGGVSEGIYAALNAGPGSNDRPEAVAENRRRIAASFDLAPERLLSLHQIHSPIAVRVFEPWTGPRLQADALVTTERGLALAILTADCAPVLFSDVNAGVIGAAHAGWKGALSGVLEACIATMEEAGADRSRIVAAIGPTIAQASYEVGPDFEARFRDADAASGACFKPGVGDRSLFDLPCFVAGRLRRAGVDAVDDLAIDTYPDATHWFSHRRAVHRDEADYGRNCAAIAL